MPCGWRSLRNVMLATSVLNVCTDALAPPAWRARQGQGGRLLQPRPGAQPSHPADRQGEGTSCDSDGVDCGARKGLRVLTWKGPHGPCVWGKHGSRNSACRTRPFM